MAFMLGAAIGGAAKRASEIFKEEAEAARETVDDAFKVLVELGLPQARKRKQLRMTKGNIYDSLANDFKFSPSQIAVIMRQNRGQETIEHLNKMRNTYTDYKINPAEIVTITQDYDGMLTKDQILENVMGKVVGGMNLSDAITDVTGKRPTGTLTGFFGGDANSVASRRMQAITAATGVSASELAGYASGEISRDPALVQGSISLRDPAGAEANPITPTAARRELEKLAVGEFGGSLAFDPESGLPRYENIIQDDQNLSREYAVDALQIFSEARARGKTSVEAYAEAAKYMKEKYFPSTPNSNGLDMGDYEGKTVPAIQAQLQNDLKSADADARFNILKQATNAIIAALTPSLGEEAARKRANQIVMGLMSEEPQETSTDTTEAYP